MKEQKRKKPKRYDYRARVLAVKSEQRLRQEGNKAMATSATPPVTASGATAPVTPAPVPTEVLKPEAQGPLSAAEPPVAAAAPAVVTPPEAPLASPPAAAAALTSPAEAPSADMKAAEPSSPASTSEGTSEATNSKPAGKKPKAEPETLEQFVEYAYGRKGQPLTLKSKVEKQIAQNARLDDAALSRLLQLTKGDTLLAVPRQILLLSQEVTGLPSLKAALTSFVANVMLRHPVFSDAGVQGALRNLPEGLPPAEALTRVAAFEPPPSAEAEPLKGGDLRDLRHNAVRLFVTWLAVNRSLNSEELSSLLFQVVWQPAAKDLADDNARLRALTDIGQAAGVGLACQRFRQQAIEARAQQDLAQREATSLRDRLSAAETQLSGTAEQLEAVRAELQALRESSSAEMGALRRQHADERTHLQHELEQLRGRLVKRLTDSVDMLEVGLSALRKDTPRVPVMVERAEHVVDALRAEVQELREE
ncbi:MAG: hypothetical protein L6Q73_13825 [Aquabacterium sp.]|nr:hypothetical protein [Aquabacterium sp.]